MSKNDASVIDVEFLYEALEVLNINDDQQLRCIVNTAFQLKRAAEEEQEAEKKTKNPRKQYLVVTDQPLKKPIRCWIIQKEIIEETMRNEDGEIEEDIAYKNWGDLEAPARIAKAMSKTNAHEERSSSKKKKKQSKLSTVAETLQYAPKMITQECGFTVKTKTPVAIISTDAESIATTKEQFTEIDVDNVTYNPED